MMRSGRHPHSAAMVASTAAWFEAGTAHVSTASAFPACAMSAAATSAEKARSVVVFIGSLLSAKGGCVEVHSLRRRELALQRRSPFGADAGNGERGPDSYFRAGIMKHPLQRIGRLG